MAGIGAARTAGAGIAMVCSPYPEAGCISDVGLPGRDTIGTLEPPLVRRSACNDVETALGSIAMMERTQSIETGQGPIAFRSREGVAEPVRFCAGES